MYLWLLTRISPRATCFDCSYPFQAAWTDSFAHLHDHGVSSAAP